MRRVPASTLTRRGCCFACFSAALLIAGWHLAPLRAEAAPRVFPPGPPPAETVDVVSLHDLTPSLRLSLTCLQGLANRPPRARIYVLQPGDGDAFWLEYLKRKGYVRQTRQLAPIEALNRHRGSCSKAFVYDPELTGSMNAAIMLASLEHGLPCHPQDVSALATGLPVVDLRGKWSSNAEAIAWAHRNLFPRMNRHMVASMNPAAAEISLYDYITAHRVFTFWITGKEREDTQRRSHEASAAPSKPYFETAGPTHRSLVSGSQARTPASTSTPA